MNEKEQLEILIDTDISNVQDIFKWVYKVESFLTSINHLDHEAIDLINKVKMHQNSLHHCDLLVAYLDQLYKDKYMNIIVPTISKTNQIFIAMQFSKETDRIYEEVYVPVIQSLQLEPMRIDKKDYAGPIIDEIASEIKNSIAIIADLTGNRGGVYYEAGIAKGLQLCNHPIKIIFTCEKNFFDDKGVHFDVKGDNILFYNMNDNFNDDLRNRIIGVLNIDTD